MWAFALLSAIIAKTSSAASTPVSTSSSSSNNVGTSKTYPLKASQKISKRELAIRSANFSPIDTFLVEGKLAVDPDSNITTPGNEGTTLVEQDGHDISYYVEVELGTIDKESKNMKVFNLVVDTGSFYTWVYGMNCDSSECSAHARFDPNESATVETTNKNFSIAYTSGTVEGVVTKDVFSFAGFQSPQQFGLASVVDSSFAHFPIDGILGLPAKDKSPKEFQGIVSTLYSQNLISRPIFGINLGRGSDSQDEGSLSIGGIDKSKYTGDITYIPLTTGDSSLFWEIPVGGLFIEGYSIDFEDTRTAIVDTGTTLLIMPPKDALKLHGYISGTRTDGSNFVIPCDTSLKLELEFNGKKFVISPEDYVGVAYSKADDNKESTPLCISNIQGIQFDNNRWILGDVFLKNVYSVYDMEQHQVGFGTKATSETKETAPNSFVYAMQNDENSRKHSTASSSSSSSKSAASTSSDSGIPDTASDDGQNNNDQTGKDKSDNTSPDKNAQSGAAAGDTATAVSDQSSSRPSASGSLLSPLASSSPAGTNTVAAAKSSASHNTPLFFFNSLLFCYLILFISL
jgi:hypothetical protein